MSKVLNLGLIGAGKWGSNYIETIKNIHGINLKSIACKSLKNKKNLLKQYEMTDDWHKLTLSSMLDGIVIASPASTHFEIASECIKNRLPIIIEKPITLNFREAKLLKDLAIKNRVIVKVNHVYLYHPLYRELKKNISKKVNLRSIHTIAGNYGPFRKDVSALWDWGPHDLSMCLDIIKEYPTKVEAEFTENYSEGGVSKSNIRVILSFKDNKYAEINIGNLMNTKKRVLKLYFDDFLYIFDPINNKSIQLESLQKQNSYNPIKNINADFSKMPLEILINEFAYDIVNSNFSMSDLKISLEVVNILEKIEEILRK